MRRNNTYTASEPSSRNDFIDLITKQDEVIVINNSLLKDLTKEVNANLSSKKQGSFFKKRAVPIAILSWTNPVGWIVSGITFLCGAFTSSTNDLKEYVIYSGYDVCEKPIVVFHHKNKVDLKYDTVNYPPFVKDVNYKKQTKRIKSK